MKAVVLAAGEGRRLEPLTDSRPKPMLPIANRPLLEHVVEAVIEAGIEEIVLVVGYKRERIQNHFGDGDDWGIDIEYAVQEKQLGTGHAVLQARELVDETFLVLNGDRIIEPTLVETLIDVSFGEDAVMSVTRKEDPSEYGVVDVTDGLVEDIAEKPPEHAVTSEFINAGVYRFAPAVFDAIAATETRGELAITATLTNLAAKEQVRAVQYRGTWLDVSHLWDLLSVNAGVLDGTSRADSTRIHETATVTGDVDLGADTQIGPSATVLGGTALGDNVSVGPGAVIDNSVVLDDVTIGAGTVLRDCVVGENVHLGPNVTVEGGSADVIVEDTLHTEVTLGGVAGDGSRIGGGVTVEPGTVIGHDASVESGTTLGGRLPAGSTITRG